MWRKVLGRYLLLKQTRLTALMIYHNSQGQVILEILEPGTGHSRDKDQANIVFVLYVGEVWVREGLVIQGSQRYSETLMRQWERCVTFSNGTTVAVRTGWIPVFREYQFTFTFSGNLACYHHYLEVVLSMYFTKYKCTSLVHLFLPRNVMCYLSESNPICFSRVWKFLCDTLAFSTNGSGT
jgi:hypothetical protein